MDIRQVIYNTFFQGSAWSARAKESNGTISYYPVDSPPTLADIRDHLNGSIVLGSYTLLPDSTVRWICLDVDATDRIKARNITEAISEVLEKIPHAIEFSGNKGYHIWIFLKEPVNATKAKSFGVRLREAVGAPTSGDPHVEVFPKQEVLTASSPMGNLVKVPLGNHPKTHSKSMFVNRLNGWEDGEEVDPIAMMATAVDFAELERHLLGATPVQKMAMLLGGYWTNGERHNLALAISGFLASLGWSRDDVAGLIEELTTTNGGEIDNLLECVTTTFRRLSEGKTVQGFSALNDKLPVTVMRSLSDLAGQNIADPAIQLIDRIRIEKGIPHLKVRSAASTMYANLSDTGRFVKTENAAYWLDLGNHRLIDMGSIEWLSTLHQRFGLNSKETFGSQVLENLRLTAFQRAETVVVHKRFHWDGSTLFINFGGAEVYKLTGKKEERSISYNGAENFLFSSSTNGLQEEIGGTNIFQADPQDPWEFLTDDLNFDRGTANAANTEQQRQLLRAWILQLFFGSVLNTRPIALLLGPRGSGKTTTARRILRFFEGFGEDVLGIAEDKPDSLRASIEDHLVLALDNMEKTRVKWLDSFLNRLSTGGHIELRQLYKSNEKYTIKPDCFVLMTGIELPTSEESLYSRILPLELSMLKSPKSEYLMQSRLKDNMVGVWAGMFNLLDGVIKELKQVTSLTVPTSSRLADFVLFCNRIKGCKAVNGSFLMEGLEGLVTRQNSTMGSTSPAISVLETWLDSCARARLLTNFDMDPTEWRSAPDIWRILQKVAKDNKINDFRWTTPAAFARHWMMLAQGGLGNILFESKEEWDSRQGRNIMLYRFPKVFLNGQVKENMENWPT